MVVTRSAAKKAAEQQQAVPGLRLDANQEEATGLLRIQETDTNEASRQVSESLRQLENAMAGTEANLRQLENATTGTEANLARINAMSANNNAVFANIGQAMVRTEANLTELESRVNDMNANIDLLTVNANDEAMARSEANLTELESRVNDMSANINAESANFGQTMARTEANLTELESRVNALKNSVISNERNLTSVVNALSDDVSTIFGLFAQLKEFMVLTSDFFMERGMILEELDTRVSRLEQEGMRELSESMQNLSVN